MFIYAKEELLISKKARYF